MWPLPRIAYDIIAWVIRPTESTLAYIQSTKDGIFIRAYQQTVFFEGENESGRVCNPTYIQKTITQFTQQHSITNTPVYCAISGPSVSEHITAVTTKNHSLYNTQYCYLYSHDYKDMYYVASLDPTVVLQHQLISIQTTTPFSYITTPFIALLKLYTIIYGNTFRRTQLAQELQQYHHRIEYCFSSDIIYRMQEKYKIKMANAENFDLVSNHYFLLISLGLFYLRR